MSPPKGEGALSAPARSTLRQNVTASSLTMWQAFKEAAVPVSVYWAAVLWAYTTFAAVILLTGSPDAGEILILAMIGGVTVVGIGLGQALAFLRVRTWIVMSFGGFCWALSIAVAAASASGLGDIGVLIALMLWLLPIALTGGLWSLETHRALWSTWLPLLYTTSAIIIWSEERGTVARWFAGEKWAIWDVVTIAVLGTEVVLLLVYLVTRETHRLALWRRGPAAPLAPTLKETGAARPRLTILSIVLLLGMAGVLTVATAVLSPYMWRTGPGDRESDHQYDAPSQPDQDPPQSVDPEEGDDFLKKLGEAMQQMGEQVVEAAKKSGGAVCSMITLAFLALLGALIGYRPLKRLFLIRHLKEPFWDVPPTTRIEQGWRLVEIALGDAGVFPHVGEDAAGLARRAAPVLKQLSPVEVHGLEDAAEVADRVRFGLGVGPEDVEVMTRFSSWVIDTVWERLGDREQVRCMYRGL